jgi:hypothetical protein
VPATQTGSVDVVAEFDSGPLAGVLRAVKQLRIRAG